MSGPVDVMAVLDDELIKAKARGDDQGHAHLREARAAVAELVEADTQLVKELHDILGDNDDVQPPETARAQVDAMRDVLRDYEMRAALAAVTPADGEGVRHG